MSHPVKAVVLHLKSNQDLNNFVVSSALSTLFCITLQLSFTATAALIAFFVVNNALARSFVTVLQTIFVSVVLSTAIVALIVLVSPNSVIKADFIVMIVFVATILISAISRFRESKNVSRLPTKKLVMNLYFSYRSLRLRI